MMLITVVPTTLPSVAVAVMVTWPLLGSPAAVTVTAVDAGIGPLTGFPPTVMGALVGSDDVQVSVSEDVTTLPNVSRTVAVTGVLVGSTIPATLRVVVPEAGASTTVPTWPITTTVAVPTTLFEVVAVIVVEPTAELLAVTLPPTTPAMFELDAHVSGTPVSTLLLASFTVAVRVTALSCRLPERA
jgi:hypothetical protein